MPSSNSYDTDTRVPTFAAADFVATVTAALFAFGLSDKLTQSDGDLFAHIALGRWILIHRAFPHHSILGFAAPGLPAVFPAWLSAAVFAGVEQLSGLAGIAALTAIVAGTTQWIMAAWLERRGLSARATVITSLLGLLLGSAHWLARPHLFSMAFAIVLLVLLESESWWGIPAVVALFATWANLHGAWLFGWILVATYVVGDVIDSRRSAWRTASVWRLKRDAGVLAGASLATLATPYGISLHRAILASLFESGTARVIDEYQPPGFHQPIDIAFYVIAALSLLCILRSWRRMSFRWVLTIGLTIAFALRAGRNIALFGLTGWPLVALTFAREFVPGSRTGEAQRENSAAFFRIPWFVPFAAAILAIGFAHGRLGRAQLINDSVDPGRFPVAAVESLKAFPTPSRTLTTWTWSGYVPFAWSGETVFFDPLVFPPAVLNAFGRMILARPGWRDDMNAAGINAVMIPVGSALGDSLAKDTNWVASYRDERTLIFRKLKS